MPFITDPITMHIKSRWPDGSYREVWAIYKDNRFKIQFDKPGICDNPADFEQYVPVADPYADHVIGNYTGLSDEQLRKQRAERLRERQAQRAEAEAELQRQLAPFLGDVSAQQRVNLEEHNDDTKDKKR